MIKEIWVNYIVENLYNLGSEWINRLKSNDEYVLAGKIVHKAQRTTKTSGKKNRTTTPGIITRHTADEGTYALDVYTTDPELITNTDAIELSYSALQSAMHNKMEWFRESIAKDAAFDAVAADTARNFLPAQVIRTTGDSVSNHFESTTVTGNRKLFTESDLQRARFAINKQKISMKSSPRTALIPSDMMQQLYDDLKKNHSEAYAKDVINGSIPMLHGFYIVETTEGVRYSNAATPVAKYYTDNFAAAENDSVVCLVDNLVSRARGNVDMFERLRDPEHYGDIYSAELRFKVQKERIDGKGVIAIVQDAA